MGLFDFLKKKDNADVIAAPVAGEAVESSQINDPTFGEEMLGKGIAIKPTDTKVYAPFDGTVALVFDTKHAISLVSETGAEVLIHVGLDTVSLKGEHFTTHVENGAAVKKGDLLMEFDKEAIAVAGFETIIPVVVCNSDDYKGVKRITGSVVKPGDTIMELEK